MIKKILMTEFSKIKSNHYLGTSLCAGDLFDKTRRTEFEISDEPTN